MCDKCLSQKKAAPHIPKSQVNECRLLHDVDQFLPINGNDRSAFAAKVLLLTSTAMHFVGM